MMSDQARSLDTDAQERSERIRRIVENCIERRIEGEAVSDASIIEAYPDLTPELQRELNNLHLIERAQREVDVALHTPHALRIRCPHCDNHVAVVDETPLSDVVCHSCGSQLTLVDDMQTGRIDQLKNIGRFKLLERLGVGAFGTVWSARDLELDRLVAVKLPRRGQLNSQDAEQFIREARAAAQLNHPNIVRVHEVGRDGDRIYIVTDLVKGVDLADWLTDQHPTPREAAELCATVADALHHAHEQGVIHRDLKPSNIMLDESGEPHLLDFGLAKREAGEITMTVDGKLLGTPAYMSPEQARGAAHDADRYSDVYSLGVVLYELLTGERPFRGSTQMLIHQVLVEDAPSPRKLNHRIPKELETICLKCLEKDRSRRYQTAKDLADDLRRSLSGEPIRARPITRATRTWRWCKRNSTVSSLAVGFVIVLLGGLVGVASQWIRAESEANRHRRLLYSSNMNLVGQAWERNDAVTAIELLNRHKPVPGQSDLRGFEWYYLWGLCRPAMTPHLDHGHDAVCDLRFTEDSQGLISVSASRVNRWDTTTLDLLNCAELGLSTIYDQSGKLSPDGKTVALGQGDGRVTLLDIDTREEHTLEGHQSQVLAVAFSKSGDIVASADRNGTVRWWNVERHELLFERLRAHERPVWCVAISPDGKTVVSGSQDETAKLWDVATGELRAELDAGELYDSPSDIFSAEFSPDSTTLATGSRNHLEVWNVVTGKPIHVLETDGWVPAVAFSADGKTLASGWRNIELRDVSSGTLKKIIRGQGPRIISLTFSPDGNVLASGTRSGKVKLRDMRNLDSQNVLRGHADEVWSVGFSHNERLLATGARNGELILWDLSNTGKRLHLAAHEDAITSLSFSPNGDMLASGSFDKTAKLWDVDTGELTFTFSHEYLVGPVAFSPSGRILAVGSAASTGHPGTVTLWDVMKHAKICDLMAHEDRVASLAFSPDGKTLASVASPGLSTTGDPTVRLWDVNGRKPKGMLLGHTNGAFRVAFSSDGQLLASASRADSTIRLWDATTQTEIDRVMDEARSVWSLAFMPDRKSLVAGHDDGTLKIWDVSDSGLLLRWSYQGKAGSLKCMAISTSGGVLATGHGDTTVRLWRAATPAEVQEAGW